jgi:hypothetical protein
VMANTTFTCRNRLDCVNAGGATVCSPAVHICAEIAHPCSPQIYSQTPDFFRCS